MDIQLLQALGGVGLFLIGMTVMTDGLRALAGDALRGLLRRSTNNPVSGATSGALATAVLQSSSATTVATVGFVGAGLISFPNALGIIFGANIGTTVTGWMVAILGFKLHLGTVATPLVLVGALMRVFGSGRWRHVGWALAGFSLLFIGIDTMQQGMTALRDIVSPTDFPGNTLLGRLQLVFIGIAITLVTQSSSAGVAVALAALAAGSISFPQAAAMVIGMDVGTTFTAALATIGGSTATRRTGFAHVLYNVLTGIMAFVLLIPLNSMFEQGLISSHAFDPQLALVAFHTAFNLIGVVAVIGFTDRFATLVIRLVPQRGPQLTARLDDRLLSDAGASVDALSATVTEISQVQFTVLSQQIGRSTGPVSGLLAAVGEALETTKRYSERVTGIPDNSTIRAQFNSTIHALDHLLRLNHRCQSRERIETITEDPTLSQAADALLAAIPEDIRSGVTEDDDARLDAMRIRLREQRRRYREGQIAAAPAQADVDDILKRLDGMRWLHRVAYHAWRIVHHLRFAAFGISDQTFEREIVLDESED